MNALARYLLVFLLGWSGAVFTYSDVIYPTNGTPNEQGVSSNKELKLPPTARGRFIPKSKGAGVLPDKEAGEPLTQTEGVSSSKKLKLPPTARGRFIQKSKGNEEPKP